MKVEQFAQIIEIAETGSFSKAARNLFISQPTLSYYVKQLEEEVGFDIFTRTSDGVVPTAQGRELLEHMQRIQTDLNYVQEFYHTPANRFRLSLKIAALNLSWTSLAFEKIVQRYSSAPINLSFYNFTSLDSLLPLVCGCQVDFAFVGILSPYLKIMKTRLENKHIEYHPIITYPICALVSEQNPLFQGRDTIKMSEIHPCTLVSYGNNDEDPSFSLARATGLGQKVHGLVQVNSSSLFYNLVKTTEMVGLLANSPTAFKQQGAVEGLRILQIEDCKIQAEEGWVKLRRVPLTDIAAEFLEHVRQLR